MKAISIKQPWAAAIMTGLKTIETRTWATNYRGDLLIVSSKSPDRAMLEYTASLASDREKYLNGLEYGKAIAVAKLVDCRLMTIADEDAAMCDIYPKAHSWVLEDVRKIEPFPVKGQLNLYDVEPPRCCEIIGPDGKVHYRRPFGHRDMFEAMKTTGYSVRYVA